jgi:hypothetical protein
MDRKTKNIHLDRSSNEVLIPDGKCAMLEKIKIIVAEWNIQIG